MKKLIILLILLTTVISCELFDAKTWEEADKRAKERGHRCYENYYGNVICEDRYSD